MPTRYDVCGFHGDCSLLPTPGDWRGSSTSYESGTSVWPTQHSLSSSFPARKKDKLWIISWRKDPISSHFLFCGQVKKVLLPLASLLNSTTNQPVFLTPLSSRVSNSSLILRSWRPYFLAAHKAGGADFDLPLNGAPSVGVPASSSPLAWSSSSLETVDAWDSELTLIRPVPVKREKWGGRKGKGSYNNNLRYA